MNVTTYHGTGHFTALCRRPCTNRCPVDNSSKQRESRGRSCRSSSCHKHSSRSTSRGRQSHRNHSHNSRRSISSSAAHHKTITRDDHPNMEDTAPYHIGIRLAILSHLIPTPKLVKVNSSLIGHLMAIDLFIQCCS